MSLITYGVCIGGGNRSAIKRHYWIIFTLQYL